MLSFLVFFSAFAVLLWSGRALPRLLGEIARFMGISEFVAAFLLMAFATSVPELFIGVSGALQGIPALSLGNVLGANFMNLTLVLGTAAIVSGSVSGDGKISSYNFLLIFFLALLPVMFALDGTISRMEGFILLVSFCLYLVKLFRDRSYFHKELSRPSSGALRSVPQAVKRVAEFFISATFLVGSSFALVSSASDIIGTYVPIGAILFGALILSTGTTLPELVSSIRAARDGRTDAVLGTVLGSVAFNAAAIIGLVAVIRPITIANPANFLAVSLFLMGALALFHTFVFTHRRLSRVEGVVLLLSYAVFFVVMFAQCAACIAA